MAREQQGRRRGGVCGVVTAVVVGVMVVGFSVRREMEGVVEDGGGERRAAQVQQASWEVVVIFAGCRG